MFLPLRWIKNIAREFHTEPLHAGGPNEARVTHEPIFFSWVCVVTALVLINVFDVEHYLRIALCVTLYITDSFEG